MLVSVRASTNSHDYYTGTEDLVLSLATDDGAASSTTVVVVVLLLVELLQRTLSLGSHNSPFYDSFKDIS